MIRRRIVEVLAQLANGGLRLVYIAPERLARSDTRALLKRSGVNLLAVDEAHCISQWGHDFRPEYLTLGALQEELGGVQTIALTATADASTRADIRDRLFRQPPDDLRARLRPTELRLAMRPKSSARRQVMDFVNAHRGQSGIVYCSSRKQTEQLAADLVRPGPAPWPITRDWTRPSDHAIKTSSCRKTVS